MSENAKNMIRAMLKINHKHRITADAALKHPWIHTRIKKVGKQQGSEKGLVLTLRNLRNFRAHNTLQKAALSYIAARFIKPEIEHQLREIFTLIDADNDGQVSEHELVKGYEALYHDKARAKHEAQTVLKLTDVNKNGMIDYNGKRLYINL